MASGLHAVGQRLYIAADTPGLGRELFALDQVLAGDFDRSGVVELADYLVWVTQFGEIAEPGLATDANNDQLIDAADYTIWRDRQGNYLDDHGDDGATSTNVNTPGVVDGVVNAPTDVDWIRFNTLAGTKYRVDLALGTLSNAGLRMYGADGITLLTSDLDGGSATVEWLATSSGVLFVEVLGIGGATGSYAVRLTTDEFGDSAELATTIAIPSTNSGVIVRSTDADWLRFNPTVGYNHRITVSLDTLSGTALRVYAADGVTLLASDVDGGAALIDFTPLAVGPYFVAITGFAGAIGSYSLVISRDDHSDLTSFATSVAVPSSTAGVIDRATDADLFSILPLLGFGQRVSLTLGTLNVAAVRVLDSSGATVAAGNVFNSSAPFDFVPTTAGPYYIEVKGANGATGSYTLTTSRDDHADVAELATSIPISTSPTGGVIGSPIDTDWFRFTVTVPGSEYRVTLNLGILAQGALRVFGPDGNTLLGSDVDGGSAAITIVPNLSGVYFAQVAGLSGANTGSYSLYVTRDDGATAAVATPLTVPASLSSDLATANDQDWFRFTGVIGVQYRVAISSTGFGSGGVTLRVYDATGATVLGSDLDGGSAVVNFTALTTGTYFASVANFSIASGSYTITVAQDDAGDGAATATTLSFPSSFDGGIGPGADRDWFRFSTVPGLAHRFTVTLGTLTGVALRIYSSNGTTLLASDTNGGAGLIDYTPTSVGPFFVEVTGFSNAVGSYTLALVRDDHGDSTTSATNVAQHGSMTGVVGTNTDVDYFAFAASAGSQVTLLVTPGSNPDVAVSLRNSGGGVLANDSDGGAGFVTFAITTAGTYYAVVSGFSGSTGSYTLLVEDHGDSALQATPLIIPSAMPGFIGAANDVDRFRFSPVAGVEHRVVVSLGSLSGAVLRIFDLDGIAALQSDVDGGIGASSFVPTTSGPYFAEVTGFIGATGSYTLSLSREDHGNSSLGATGIAVPSTATGLIESPTDLDWFRFTGTAGVNYRLTLTLNLLTSGTLRIFDTTGTTVLASDLDGGAALIDFTPTSTGTYYAEVGGFSGAMGTYSLGLAVAPPSSAAIAVATAAVSGVAPAPTTQALTTAEAPVRWRRPDFVDAVASAPRATRELCLSERSAPAPSAAARDEAFALWGAAGSRNASRRLRRLR